MESMVLKWLQLVCASLLLSHTSAGAQTRGLPAGDQAVLSVGGRINPPMPHNSFDLRTLESLPQHKFTTMTPWSDKSIHFSGPLLRDVLSAAGAKGKNIRATAINDYRIQIPLSDAMRFDVIVATRMNGERMSVRDKGPLFVVYPFDSLPELQQARYYERSIWQLKSLEVE